MPDLTGKTEQEATELLEKSKLKKGKVESEASADVEEGKIISQNPKSDENQKVEEGTAVQITLSTGPETTELPDFTGKEIGDVREEAKKMGITIKEVDENSNSVEENKVIGQETKAGVLVKSGDTITIHVSKGVKKTTVPTVFDMDEGTAKATLSNANLKANITYTSDETKTDGKVISQSIEQGKEVAQNTTIDLVVNKIEKKESTAKVTLELTVSSSMIKKNSSKTSNTTNTVAESTKISVPIIVTVNGKEQIKKTVTVDLSKEQQEISLGEIHGNGSQTIVVEGKVNGETKTLGTTTQNIDDYNGNNISIDCVL